MKCRQCGQECPSEAKFCSECGSVLHDSLGDTTTVLPVIGDDKPAELSATEVEAVRQLAPGDALLIVNRGGTEGERFLVNSDLTTMGRHPESDIFLDDITVSRHHAKLIRSAGRLYLEDLGSLNGTYVNRTLVDGRVPLHNEDEIQIGKYRFKFVFT